MLILLMNFLGSGYISSLILVRYYNNIFFEGMIKMARSKKEITGYLSDALNNGLWDKIFIELIYSNNGVCRAYLGGEATTIYAGGGGYDKKCFIVGKVGLLINTDDQEYVEAMKYGASGGGDMIGLVEKIAEKLSEMHKIRCIGCYQHTKAGYTVVFIKVV